MIISVSRRTDIPAFYSEWFFHKLKKGYVLVRNPVNKHQIRKIPLDKESVDCFVFWSKNPKPMLKKINELDDFNYYFQFTINPYDKNIETYIPKKKYIVPSFKEIAKKIGKNRVIWRYDPIFLNSYIDMNYHKKYFDLIASELWNYTEKCIISFMDFYKKCEKNVRKLAIHKIDENTKREVAYNLKIIADKYGLKLETCAEDIDLDDIGIPHGKCIDDQLINKICKSNKTIKKDKNQREACLCRESIDIGAYNTCQHGCLYCYANFNHDLVKKNIEFHNPNSSLLIGETKDTDKIYEVKVNKTKSKQLSLLSFNKS